MRAAGGSPVGAATPNASRKEEAALATPMIAQYLEIKAANADCLLFYRMGDFYELFFEDAEIASRALGIALTKRGKHLGEDIPMCGVPVHAADDYLQRLIAGGPPRRGLRADRGPGRGQEARAEGGGAPRRGAPRHPGHADRGDAARCARAQLSHRSVPRPCQGGQRAGLRARLSRHLDRRIDRLVGRRQRSFRRACAAEARRSAGRRRSRRRCRAAPPDRGGGRRPHALSPRPFRFATRRARPEGTAGRGRARCVRRIHQGGACGARWPAHLCRDHPGRQSAAAPPAAQRKRGQPADHRRRHARQSRADALEPGRARRQPARRHRPHRHRGWRARACQPAGQPADRSGRR